MKVRKIVMYALYTPKVFNFSKSHYLYFMHSNTFFRKGARKFHQTRKTDHGTKMAKNPCFKN
jgi:hypothetical protein